MDVNVFLCTSAHLDLVPPFGCVSVSMSVTVAVVDTSLQGFAVHLLIHLSVV